MKVVGYELSVIFGTEKALEKEQEEALLGQLDKLFEEFTHAHLTLRPVYDKEKSEQNT